MTTNWTADDIGYRTISAYTSPIRLAATLCTGCATRDATTSHKLATRTNMIEKV
jgi:hypothetical protein